MESYTALRSDPICLKLPGFTSRSGVLSAHRPSFFSVDTKSPLFSRSLSLSVSMCLKGSDKRIPGYEANTALKHTENQSEHVINDMHVRSEEVLQSKKHAKIHDFCLGIPFGGVIFSGGLVGFLFSRNPANLTSGVMFGGAILAMGVISLKVWRKGLSSLPLILGQAVLAATLLWKHIQSYTLTKKIFPTGFYAAMSAAMLCFYAYVIISGGNPPPKKKLTAAAPS